MVHIETSASASLGAQSISDVVSDNASQKPVRKKRPMGFHDLIWDRFQTYGKIFLGTAILLTLLYLFAFPLPLIFSEPIGAPIFRAWPKVNWIILLTHAVTAIPPLIIGIIAFSKRLRNASLKWHRWIGTTYCICIWISAALGIMLAIANVHGPIAKFGFGFLGIGWFTTTWFAYTSARAKNILSHRRWMIRSYALTLAVVSIRPLFSMEPVLGISTENWYLMATWACWVPNLIMAEIYIRATQPTGKLKYTAA